MDYDKGKTFIFIKGLWKIEKKMNRLDEDICRA